MRLGQPSWQPPPLQDDAVEATTYVGTQCTTACMLDTVQGGRQVPARQRTSRFMGVGASNRAGQWQVTRIHMRSRPTRDGHAPRSLRQEPGGMMHHG